MKGIRLLKGKFFSGGRMYFAGELIPDGESARALIARKLAAGVDIAEPEEVENPPENDAAENQSPPASVEDGPGAGPPAAEDGGDQSIPEGTGEPASDVPPDSPTPEGGGAPAASISNDYAELGVTKLRALAKERGVAVPKKAEKGEIVALLVAADMGAGKAKKAEKVEKDDGAVDV